MRYFIDVDPYSEKYIIVDGMTNKTIALSSKASVLKRKLYRLNGMVNASILINSQVKKYKEIQDRFQ